MACISKFAIEKKMEEIKFYIYLGGDESDPQGITKIHFWDGISQIQIFLRVDLVLAEYFVRELSLTHL